MPGAVSRALRSPPSALPEDSLELTIGQSCLREYSSDFDCRDVTLGPFLKADIVDGVTVLVERAHDLPPLVLSLVTLEAIGAN